MQKMILWKWLVIIGLVSVCMPCMGQVTVLFTFDEFDGFSFTDHTGYGLQGEVVSGDLTEPESIPGVSGSAGDNALSFDGQGSLVADDTETGILDVFPPFTLETWARSSESDQTNTAWISYGFNDRSDQIPGGYRLGVQDGNLIFTMYGVVDVQSEVAFPFDGEWHHVAAVYDFNAGVVRFYLDGEEQQAIEEAGVPVIPDRFEISFGAVSPGFLQWTGDIDRPRISNTALTAEELDSNPTEIKPVVDTTVAYFSFDETNQHYMSEGASDSLEAISVVDMGAEGIEYERIPKTAEIVSDSPSGADWDTALQFTGREYALVVDPDGILEFEADWTLEAWIKPAFVEGRTNAMVLYAYGAPGGGHSLQLAYDAEDPTQLVIRGTAVGVLDVPSTTRVPYDEWHHIAVVYRDGESMSFYLDGGEPEVISYEQGTNPRANEFLYIGTWPNALAYAYVGVLDRIRFSDHALTAEEMDTDPNVIVPVKDWSLY